MTDPKKVDPVAETERLRNDDGSVETDTAPPGGSDGSDVDPREETERLRNDDGPAV